MPRGRKKIYSDTERKRRRKESIKKYRESPKGKAMEKSQFKKHREWHTKSKLKKYNLTLEDYDNMFECQKGVCAICGGINLSGRRLGVDHDHKTGTVRGLLCLCCNSHLGWYETNRQQLEKYLEIGEIS